MWAQSLEHGRLVDGLTLKKYVFERWSWGIKKYCGRRNGQEISLTWAVVVKFTCWERWFPLNQGASGNWVHSKLRLLYCCISFVLEQIYSLYPRSNFLCSQQSHCFGGLPWLPTFSAIHHKNTGPQTAALWAVHWGCGVEPAGLQEQASERSLFSGGLHRTSLPASSSTGGEICAGFLSGIPAWDSKIGLRLVRKASSAYRIPASQKESRYFP